MKEALSDMENLAKENDSIDDNYSSMYSLVKKYMSEDTEELSIGIFATICYMIKMDN